VRSLGSGSNVSPLLCFLGTPISPATADDSPGAIQNNGFPGQNNPRLDPAWRFHFFGNFGVVLKVHESRIRGFLANGTEGHSHFSSVVDHAP
jgi:hypothetical protein